MRFMIFLLLGMLLNAYQVNILNVQGDNVTFDRYVQKGVSGLVLCPYEGHNIICAKVLSLGTKGRLEVYKNLKNSAFALPVVLPEKNDKIVFAKDYDRILIIAPNQEEYLIVKSKYPNDTVISSDIFAEFLDGLPTKENFINFAKKMNIGRIIFVLDKIYEVDADSFYQLKAYGKNSVKYNQVFFTTFPKEKTDKNLFKYYKSMIKE